MLNYGGYTVSDEVHGQRATRDHFKRPFRGPGDPIMATTIKVLDVRVTRSYGVI